MKYLTVDGMMSGTGIRDSVEGGYIRLADLGLSELLAERIRRWLRDYETAHYDQYQDDARVSDLDEEGFRICDALREELPDAKVEYYSSALLRKLTR